jgi:hypothetical protein
MAHARPHPPQKITESMTMRLCRRFLAVAIIAFATPSLAEPLDGARPSTHLRNFESATTSASHGLSDSMPAGLATSARPFILASNEAKPAEPDTDLFALMSGKCSTLTIASRNFACRAVAYFHGEQGRANFTIALDDPADDSHIISFSGETARREEQNSLYELQIDRMLLSSKDRPKVDGLPVPFVELSNGTCKQFGNLAALQISSIVCSAVDRNGMKYELRFESDGKPITLRRVRQMPLVSAKRRARQTEQLQCREKAGVARVLPRDRPAFILECLAENGEKIAPAEPQ